MIYSFDIFDTCLVRLCGTPNNFFDVLSRKVFTAEVDEMTRQEFIIQRRLAEKSLWEKPNANIDDIYRAFSYTHSALLPADKLTEVELSLERIMLVPVISIKNEIVEIHKNSGNVMFISDMYIPGAILIDILTQYGFFVPGDKLYVSCDVGARKHDGSLFEYIHYTEGIDYHDWIHKGDNANGDYIQPKKLGIKSFLVSNGYTPIQKCWLNQLQLHFNYSGILAGLSRAIGCSMGDTERRDFILDFIAPLYCSFVYNVLKDASENGLKRIFFCARDTYQMFRLALTMQPMFPELEIKYLRISRVALYEGDSKLRMRYFIQEKLASQTERCAIVDSTSSGKTVKTINEELVPKGFLPVKAYYLLKWDDQGIDMEKTQYVVVWRQFYIENARGIYLSEGNVLLIENFFSTNCEKRTVNYSVDGEGTVFPVYSGDVDIQDSVQDNVELWQEYEASLLACYSDAMKKLGLYDYSTQILCTLAVPTLFQFLSFPIRYYLKALTGYRVYTNSNSIVPYVRKESLFRLLRTRGSDSGWKQGTIVYNMPDWFLKLRWQRR